MSLREEHNARVKRLYERSKARRARWAERLREDGFLMYSEPLTEGEERHALLSRTDAEWRARAQQVPPERFMAEWKRAQQLREKP